MSELLKEKLSNYEVSPPPVVWESIHQELEESNALSRLSNKMYNYEVEPPALAWQTITQGISEVIPVHQIPVKSISRKFYRIAAAAAVLGVVLAGSFYLFNNISTKLQISSNKQRDQKGDTQTLPQQSRATVKAPDVPEEGIARHMNTTISGTSGYRAQKKKRTE